MSTGISWIDSGNLRLARKAMKPGTAKSYDSNLRMLTKTWFVDEHRCLQPNLRDLLIWVAIMDDKGGAASINTILGVRASVRKVLKQEGTPQDATYHGLNTLIDEVIKGYAREYPPCVIDYGPIVWDKMEALLQLAEADTTVMADIYWGMAFQWAFALRVSQVAKVRACDLRRRKDGRWEYCCARQKGHTAAADEEVEYHLGAPQTTEYINRLLALRAGLGPGEYLLPGYTIQGVNAVIRRAAVIFGWNLTLQWSSHSLRHGSLTQARREGGMEAVALRGAQLSAATRELYSREESQRNCGVPGQRRMDAAKARRAKAQAKAAKAAPASSAAATRTGAS